jgi:hypothetical protein
MLLLLVRKSCKTNYCYAYSVQFLCIYKFIYTNYCTPITYIHSIYCYMFRLTFSVIITESSSIELRSMQPVIEW